MKNLLTSFDTLLVATVFIIMIRGLLRRWSIWRKKKQNNVSGCWRGIAEYLVKHAEILKRPHVGMAHIAVLWAFVLPMLVIILAQLGFSIPGIPAYILSLIQEAAGAVMLAGVIYLLIRRIGLRDAQGPKKTLLPILVLLIVLVSGFLAESTRLSIAGNSPILASPLGWILSIGTPASPLFMQMMIRLHFFAVLFFFATIPYTFMRHVFASPLNVFYRKQGPKAALRQIDPLNGETGAETAEDFSWKQLLEVESCVSCGRCEENCPAAISGKALSPRKVIRKILEHAENAAGAQNFFSKTATKSLLEETITDQEIWDCTTCMACVEHCPVFVEAMDKIVEMRRHLVMGKAQLPSEAKPMIRDLELFGDVQGKGVAHRSDWAMHRDIPHISKVEDAEVLFWVGCSGAFHPRNQETALAMAKILKSAGIKFGILGHEELCCGDPARRLGEETLYQKLAKQNIGQFKKYNVKKIVTLCPHCLNTLKNEYPELGCDVPVVHATEYVMDLIRQSKLDLKYPVADKITIHDACYLGRYNEVYQPPRDICAAVPGTEIKELKRNKESGFCCGGGGGRMWLHEGSGQNINVLRAEEVVDAGVDIVGTSCPYCLVMLDDGVKSLERDNLPKVADVIDIVADAIK